MGHKTQMSTHMDFVDTLAHFGLRLTPQHILGTILIQPLDT